MENVIQQAQLPSKQLYLEDIHVGQRFTSGTYMIEEAAIKEFAAQFDPQPFHPVQTEWLVRNEALPAERGDCDRFSA